MLNAGAQQGCTAAEYGILLALVAGVSIYGLKTLGPAFSGNFKKVDSIGTLSLLAPLGEKGGKPSSAGGNSKFPTPVSPPPILNNPDDITVDQLPPFVAGSLMSGKASGDGIGSLQSSPSTIAGGLGSQVTEAEKEPTATPSDNSKNTEPGTSSTENANITTETKLLETFGTLSNPLIRRPGENLTPEDTGQ